jgi:hypothetical protein
MIDTPSNRTQRSDDPVAFENETSTPPRIRLRYLDDPLLDPMPRSLS